MRSILLVFGLLSFSSLAQTNMKELPFHEPTIREDFSRILTEANLQNKISVEFKDGPHSEAKLLCKTQPVIVVTSPTFEKTSTFYKAIREIGFLFPHPLKQISPNLKDIEKKCNRTWNWRPALKYRGFHLHTLHPSEWVGGFYQGHPDVAEQTIRWMARNQQNIFDLSLPSVPLSEISRLMKPHFELARKFQIHTGVSLGIALNQQNSYKLLSLWDSYVWWKSDQLIKLGILKLIQELPLSYMVLEAGTSEFTPTNFEKTLNWLNLSSRILKEHDIVHFTKVHVSSNQFTEPWGNFNFLPQFANKEVGILPHTVMFYGLNDPKAPMYGNKNFHHIRDFMLKEKDRRPTWYYGETSYWVGMDVDVPLLLTDYLRARAQDTKYLYEKGIEGQLNFTTGHALGYWLFDWSYALLNDLDFSFDETAGLKLLGEDPVVWEKIISYQMKWYKEKALIKVLSSANIQDELSPSHRIHERYTMKELSQNPNALKEEISLIRQAELENPSLTGVKNEELKTLLEVNELRRLHALYVRLALQDKKLKDKYLNLAKETRHKAQGKIRHALTLGPQFKAPISEKWSNPTAYQFGYIYTALELYFWEREENQIKDDSYFPLWNNLYDLWDIVI